MNTWRLYRNDLAFTTEGLPIVHSSCKLQIAAYSAQLAHQAVCLQKQSGLRLFFILIKVPPPQFNCFTENWLVGWKIWGLHLNLSSTVVG